MPQVEAGHSRYNFTFSPDYGGTSYEFVKDLSRDKCILKHVVDSRVTKAEIPREGNLIVITLSEGNSGDFFYAFYSAAGELISAQIHFRKYCEQSDFLEKAKPSQELLDAYWQMKDAEEDIVLSVDMETGNYTSVMLRMSRMVNLTSFRFPKRI